MKNFLLVIVILFSLSYTIGTFMTYIQSGYERGNSKKIEATIIGKSDVIAQRVKRLNGRSSYFYRYNQDLDIQFTYNEQIITKHCKMVMTNYEEGYEIGRKIECYYDGRGNVTFGNAVQEKIYPTMISFIILIVAIKLKIKASKKVKN